VTVPYQMLIDAAHTEALLMAALVRDQHQPSSGRVLADGRTRCTCGGRYSVLEDHHAEVLSGPGVEYDAFAASHDPDPQCWTPDVRGEYAGLDHGTAAPAGIGGVR
jgi:hypothetical protein